jgi:hypothetical protein
MIPPPKKIPAAVLPRHSGRGYHGPSAAGTAKESTIRKHTMKKFLYLATALPLVACTVEVESTTETPAGTTHTDWSVSTQGSQAPESPSAQVPDGAVEAGAHTVKCGCVIAEVGHCGNYIAIDSTFIPIANGDELGLGDMEWCGQGDVQAKAAGMVQDGKFVATLLTTGK